MKKKLTLILLVLSLLVTLLVGFTIKASLMRLEIVNKSAYPAHLWLTEFTPGAQALQTYYLNVDSVSSLTGVWNVKVYTLVRGLYNLQLDYCDLEQPTYFQLDLTKSYMRFVIPACAAVPNAGEANVIKLNPNLYPPDEDGVGLTYILIDYPFKWRY